MSDKMIHDSNRSELRYSDSKRPGIGRKAGLVLLVAIAMGAIVDPKAVVAGLAVIGCAGLLVAFLAMRALWRTWRRPIGTISAGDAILWAAAYRWWHRRHP